MRNSKMLQEPRPVSTGRIAAYFDIQGYTYAYDDDCDLEAGFDDNHFSFILQGSKHEVLVVRGTWNQYFPAKYRDEFADFLNTWNRERLWPKAYLLIDEDNEIQIHGEVAADLEYGVTDEQLEQLLECGIGTCLSMFNELDRRYPNFN
ncbi:YbjN domain-containing protein [Corynebacterium sp. HS2168-gen11]|uniref:YbjN domain-containing protein n=1 Tax=Corynebacterium sp. HS2168-gen11 TaxID=2974027 RepID=UPI00216AC040|nr:YbjN domain-containing protein [Corynebacterium sp. HS2168-gen11]MCS4535533.1 YbjN domain-containing protein [Corynebacterium sp. HS2168-gen11]